MTADTDTVKSGWNAVYVFSPWRCTQIQLCKDFWKRVLVRTQNKTPERWTESNVFTQIDIFKSSSSGILRIATLNEKHILNPNTSPLWFLNTGTRAWHHLTSPWLFSVIKLLLYRKSLFRMPNIARLQEDLRWINWYNNNNIKELWECGRIFNNTCMFVLWIKKKMWLSTINGWVN